MRILLILIAPALFFTACNTIKPVSFPYSDQISINKLDNKSYIHTSYLITETWGRVPCNGMIVLNKGEAIIIDAPVDESSTLALIQFVEVELKATIKAVIATHFHIDCIGGLPVFHQKGIPSYGLQKTIELCEAKGDPFPQNGFEGTMELIIGNQTLQLFHPGEGHTIDNIVVYYPASRALFGGCLVKRVGAGKGNLTDANIRAWSPTIIKVQQQFPEVRWVVPGHGKAGGSELLEFTRDLFAGE